MDNKLKIGSTRGKTQITADILTVERYQKVLNHILYCDRLGMWLMLEPELYLTDDECALMATECGHTADWIRQQVRRAATGVNKV